jgi:hypothetical protein
MTVSRRSIVCGLVAVAVHALFPHECRRTPGHVLVQEDLHEAVLISMLSSTSIAAA